MSNAVLPGLPGLTWDVKMRPRFDTKIQTAKSGKELRAQFMAYPMWEFDLTYEFLRQQVALAELQQLVGFFNARNGSYDTWLYNNPVDNAVAAQQFAIGDGATSIFQLTRPFGGFVEPVQNLNGAPSIFVNDWEGNQLQYATPRQNLALQAEDLTTTWSKTNLTVNPNAVLAPDGTNTGDQLLETAVNATHPLAQNFAKAATPLTYTLKFWCQAVNGRNTFRVQLNDGGANAGFSDVDLGAVTASSNNSGFTGTAASVVAGPNSTFLVTLQTTSNSAALLQILIQTANPAGTVSFLGDITKGLMVWGVDLKQTTAALTGSYIKTTTVPVTVTDYTLGSTGLVTFAVTPLAAALLSWTGSYYYRCRFMDDMTEFNNFLGQLWENQKLSFVSVKL